MKEFDLEKAKAGAPVCTRDGRPARIVCWDAIGEHLPILALVTEKGSKGELYESSYWYENNGKSDEDKDSDLMMADIKHEGWVIICKHSWIFSSEHDAYKHLEDFSSDCHVAHIEWKE